MTTATKSEQKIETDRGEYKTEEKMKTDDDGSSKYREARSRRPTATTSIEQKVDEHGNVKTDVTTITTDDSVLLLRPG